ncbi:DUF3575 domain-containing protein [Microvirga sp. STR05]|uniref:DUF3575 domain-containing protein n=1 Tax=Hymenobacter duratus TaxID=2771356 RepID=A0ABR8JAT0_9BACT|nr:outer membrane beta-barrel protein [Hymenobacter duratus]MBD2713721.1 DUF3575 domain-containing protein [Hymenobacter duratus]MBR7948623.1 DUF3575 domain-containing protein [Microvirga sp. STR05]
MRKILLAGLGCALATGATAQTEKGARFIGANLGDLSYSRGKQNYGNSRFSVSLFPSVGVFVANNFLLGANLELGYSSIKSGNSSGDYSTRVLQYGVSPFVRYYLPSTSAHRFFGQVGAGVLGQTAWYPNYYDGERQSSTNFASRYGVAVGYNYFLTPGAALEVVAGYGHNSNRNAFSSGALNVQAGFSIFLPSRVATTAPTE